jgi:hypothetical protein
MILSASKPNVKANSQRGYQAKSTPPDLLEAFRSLPALAFYLLRAIH